MRLAAGALTEGRRALERLAAMARAGQVAEVRPLDPEAILAKLAEQDEQLIAKGFPPITEWWWNVLRVFLRSGRRNLVLRVGRRGGKSTTMCRLGICLARHGEYHIPPGDVGLVSVLSVRKEDAHDRLRTLKAILDALGESHHPVDGGIGLDSRPVVFRCQAARTGAVVGGTGIFLFCDEVAHWRDAATGANPATEVLGELRPTMTGQVNARMVLCSAPLGQLDAHADAVREGNNERQLVFEADSFTARPNLSVEQSHIDEPDPAKWKRQYMAVPLEGSVESLYYATLLDKAKRKGPKGDLPRVPGWSYVAWMDQAFSGNAWTLVIATRDTTGRKVVAANREWRGTTEQPLIAKAIFGEMLGTPEEPGVLRKYGLTLLHGDEHGTVLLAQTARECGITLVQENMTAGRKVELYEDFGVLLVNEQAEIPDDPQFRADLLGVRRVLTRNGFVIELTRTPDGRHCDYAPSGVRALTAYIPMPVPVRQGDAPNAAQIMADDMKRDLAKYAPKKGRGGPAPLPALLQRGRRVG